MAKKVRTPAALLPLPRATNPRIKLNRAIEHITEIRKRLKAVSDSKPYQTPREVDPDTGEAIYRLRIVKDLPIQEIQLLTGDAVHNLRSALDHAVICLLAAAKAPGHTRRTGFPIFVDAGQYNDKKADKVDGMSEEAKRLIDEIRPYKGGYGLLWQLHELDIIDKHRLLVAIGSARYERTFIRISPLPFFAPIPVNRLLPDVVEDGAILLRTPGDKQVDVKKAFTFFVSIHEPGVIDRQPLATALDNLKIAVDRTIARLEPLYLGAL